ncbi:MAG: hypothetical protein GU361_01320 [Desulfurococcales archaeon]|nr:hypothetical protein [Desulfurococcales archaeon]
MAERRTKLVPVSEDDLERLREIANTIGVPLRELISRMFRDGATLALISGGRLSEVEAEYKALKELGRVGFALLPVSTLNKLVHNSSSIEDALRDAREVGRGVGTLYRVSGLIDDEHIHGFIKAVFPDSTQVNIKSDDENLVLTVVAMARTKESIDISSALIEGFLESLGYAALSKEVTSGLLVAQFKKQRR